MLTVNPSFDLLAKVIAPEFTMAQGVKEIIDNAIQSLIFFLIDRPNLSDEGWTPQIVIIIDLDCDLHRGRLRIVDNGGGLNPQQMKEWAECGNSTNRSRVTKMLEVDAKDPRVVGLCSNLISSYGIGGKGGGAALTREGKDINGNITLFSCRGADEDGHMNLQKINFNLKEAQRRQVDKDESPWNREYTPNLDLSDEPELKGYMQRPGWGDRITCLEVDNLSRAVLEQLRGLGSRTELVNEIVGRRAQTRTPQRLCRRRPQPAHATSPCLLPVRPRPGRSPSTQLGTTRSPVSATRSTGRATRSRCTSRPAWRCAVAGARRRRRSTSTR
jgi:hypothetical protein